MKKILILILMVMVSSVVVSQNRTNIWQMGDGPSGYNFGIDFNSGVADTFTQTDRWLRMIITNAAICDTNGNLLFYTNGKYTANRNNDTLFNSDGFNPGYETTVSLYGIGLQQGAVIIPFPNDNNKYYLFHESSNHILTDSFSLYLPTNLSYTVIDMSLDNGLGGMVESLKNIHLVDDTLAYGRIAACKHANGRDWWIVVQKYYSDLYYEWLVTPTGIQGPFIQHIGIILPETALAYGAARFSPDGSKYATIGLWSRLQVMDFDRCNGELSNLKFTSSYVDTVPEATLCGEFSPNNRFFYVTDRFHLFQFDTWAANLDLSKIFVADYDTSLDWDPFFNITQQASDGYIYVSSYGSSNYLHYIENPDSLGLSCNVQIAGLITPFINGYGPPYFPNYDLGPLEGSPCDTLSTQNIEPETPTFHFSPNPATTYTNIVYTIEHNATLTITNTYGSMIKQLTLYPYFKNRIVSVDDLAEGIYLVTMKEGSRISSKKIVVER